MRCLPTEIQATPYTHEKGRRPVRSRPRPARRQDVVVPHAAPHRARAHADAPVRPRVARPSTLAGRTSGRERVRRPADPGPVFVPCACTATGHWPLARVRVPRQVYLSVPRKCTASAHFHALLGLALRRGTGRCLGRSLGRCMLFWLPAQVVELVLVPLPKVLRLALLRRKFRRERQPSHQHVHLV